MEDLFRKAGWVIVFLCAPVIFASDDEPIPPDTTPRAVRIMPVGDSRTAGPSARTSYRFYLDRLMTAAGLDFDFVGTKKGHGMNDIPPPSSLAFKSNHQGMWGWPVENLVKGNKEQGNIRRWASDYRPDIVLMLVGFPEIVQDRWPKDELVKNSLGYSKACIDTLRAINPAVKVLFANVYPYNPAMFYPAGSTYDDKNPMIEEYNSMVPEFVDSLTTEESPVILVDVWTGFDIKTDLVDWLHAGERGCPKIAANFFRALWPFFSSEPFPELPVSIFPYAAPPKVPLILDLAAGDAQFFNLLGRHAAGSAVPILKQPGIENRGGIPRRINPLKNYR